VFLAAQARHVHVLIRGPGLRDTMSRYLVRRIEETRNITLHPHTELVALDGDDRLRSVTWRGPKGTELHPIAHVFLMIGAQPNSAWLGDCVALDDRGFVKTGTDLTADDLSRTRWPAARAPSLDPYEARGVARRSPSLRARPPRGSPVGAPAESAAASKPSASRRLGYFSNTDRHLLILRAIARPVTPRRPLPR
jgi:hypothetical protein